MKNIKNFTDFINEAWTKNGDFVYNDTISDIEKLCNKEQIEYLDKLAIELVPIYKRGKRKLLKGDWLLRDIGDWLDDIDSIGNDKLHQIRFADMSNIDLDGDYCIILDYVMLQMVKNIEPSYIKELLLESNSMSIPQ